MVEGVVVVLLLLSCAPGHGPGSGEHSASLDEVCERILDCGGWGYDSAEQCRTDWMGDEATGCIEGDQYLSCMTDCLPERCEEFATCESDCWISACTAEAFDAR